MKRTFDFFFSLLGLIVLAPILFLTFIFVKVSSKGHGFYVQSRVGRNNTDFDIVKFRTMNEGASKFGLLTIGDKDPRITRIGYYLRKFKLDELPKLINVIKGDMSFVGPRPALFNQDELIALRTESGVEGLVPGLTGWAQVNGRDELPITEKVKLDVEYLKKCSFFFDLWIIWLTLVKILRRDGVSH